MLADRLNRIICEKNISKREFAKALGISENYVYVLTSDMPSRAARNKKISPLLAKLIAKEYGYDENWILYGEEEHKHA